jgi:hypothetical protein
MKSPRSHARPVQRPAHQSGNDLSSAKTLQSSGRALGEDTRRTLESRFDFSFAGVQVHDNSSAADFAHDLGANAVTIGSDLYFGADKYAPATEDGNRLLAHELTHVVQNERAPADGLFSLMSDPTSSSEVEAHAVADSVAAGYSVSPSASPTSAIALDEEEGEHHHKGGILDHLFGLNPDKSFVESGMEGLGYGRDGIWGRPPKEDEGQGTTALRALGAAATSPLAVFAAIGGHGLDEINHGPSLLHGGFDW